MIPGFTAPSKTDEEAPLSPGPLRVGSRRRRPLSTLRALGPLESELARTIGGFESPWPVAEGITLVPIAENVSDQGDPDKSHAPSNDPEDRVDTRDTSPA